MFLFYMILDTADTGWNVLILHDFGRYGGALDPFFFRIWIQQTKKDQICNILVNFFYIKSGSFSILFDSVLFYLLKITAVPRENFGNKNIHSY